jgi:hypothetical protein
LAAAEWSPFWLSEWSPNNVPKSMALSTEEICALAGAVRRALRPGGTFDYTFRRTGDAHDDDIYENGGFAVHFFPRHRRRL